MFGFCAPTELDTLPLLAETFPMLSFKRSFNVIDDELRAVSYVVLWTDRSSAFLSLEPPCEFV